MESRSSVFKVVKLRLVVNTERVQITLRKVFQHRHSKPVPVVLMQNCSSPKCYRLKITYAPRDSSKFKLCKFQKSLGNLLFHMLFRYKLHSKICLLKKVCVCAIIKRIPFLPPFFSNSRAAGQMMVVIMQIGTQIPAKREQIRISWELARRRDNPKTNNRLQIIILEL